jgi:serine/threonine protein kinase
MELMHWSLHSIIHDTPTGEISFSTRLKLLRDVASALEFLHLQRYIHQDIKPSNVLVDERCTIAKLTDFGVAERKGFDTTRTRRHSTVVSTVLECEGKKAPGTLTYQAPEIILGKCEETSRDAEMYSFGVTIWECTTRQIPHYKKEQQIQALAKHAVKPMLSFPLKALLENKDAVSVTERLPFQLLEKVAYLCLSKYRQDRPNATQVLQYFDGNRQFNIQFLAVAPLSQWYDSSTSRSNEPHMRNNRIGIIHNDPNMTLISTARSNVSNEKDYYNLKANANIMNSIQQDLDHRATTAISDINRESNSFGADNPNKNDDFNTTTESSTKKSKIIQWAQQNWIVLLLIGLVAIIIIVVTIILLQKKSNNPNQGTSERLFVLSFDENNIILYLS